MGEEKYNATRVKELLRELEDWLNADEKNLFMNEYWTRVGLNRQNVKEMLYMHPYLQEDYDRLVEMQQYKMLKAGLFKELDSNLTKFVLSSKYNWKDKQIVEQTVSMKEFDITKLVKFKDNKDE